MTSRERVPAALRREAPDRVPIVECIDWVPMVRIAQLLGADVPPADEPFAFERLAATLTEALGIEAVWVAMPLGETPVDEHHVRDRYGSVYVLSEHGEPVVEEGPVGSLADVGGLDPSRPASAAVACRGTGPPYTLRAPGFGCSRLPWRRARTCVSSAPKKTIIAE